MKSLFCFKTSLGFLLIALGCSFVLRAQSTNPPLLSLTGVNPPALTLSGVAGTSYQVQFTAQIPASNGWAALTNVQLNNSRLSFQDGTVQQGAARFYRALIINSNTFLGYVSPQLTAGEILDYDISSNPGSETENTLFVLSPTNGVLLTGGENIVAYPVIIHYTASNLITAGISLIFPSGTVFPGMAATNPNTMLFTATNEGAILDFGTGPVFNVPPAYGTFQLDTSFVGQVLALSQLHEGEMWQFTTANYGTTNSGTLVVESATNGWWIGSVLGAAGEISPVRVQISPQNTFSSLLSVVFSNAQGPNGTTLYFTNIYLLYFTSLNSGQIQGPTNSQPQLAWPSGIFIRNTNFVGQTLAPPQLVAGDLIAISNVLYPYVPQMLLVDSTNSWWYLPSGGPDFGITNVAAQFNPLGPMSGDLVIAYPGSFTNTNLLVFTSNNFGTSMLLPSASAPSGNIEGFSISTNLVGQSLAPSQLAAGQSYVFPLSYNPPPVTEFEINITILSDTNALWIAINPIEDVYLSSAVYTPLGLFAGSLTVVVPPNPTDSVASTNVFCLLFTTPGGGWVQGSSGVLQPPGPDAINTFALNTNLVGQTFASPQISQGDSFQFAQTNASAGTDVLATLVMTSSATADWFESGYEINFQSSQVQYVSLGPIAANMSVILPGSSEYPSGVTNNIFLLYNSGSGGLFVLTNYSSSSQIIGTFTNSPP